MTRLRLNWRYGLLPAIVFLTACSQEPPKELCAQLNSVIDRSIVDIAVSNFAGEDGDKSAMQQSARSQDNQGRLSMIMINVQLQAQNKCSPRAKPIEPTAYEKNAAVCYLARRDLAILSYGPDKNGMSLAAKKVTASCDFSQWSPQQAK
jgi:hypothetical protein